MHLFVGKNTMNGVLKHSFKTANELVDVTASDTICVAVIKPRQIVMWGRNNGNFIASFKYDGIHFSNDTRMYAPKKHCRKEFKKTKVA